MASLDYKYLKKLVLKAQIGDSDAFAEIYAATYKQQYLFSYGYLHDEHLAQDALQETFTLALKNIATLRDPSLLVAWLNQINFRVCYGMKKKQYRYDNELSDYEDIVANEYRDESKNPETVTIRIDSKEYIMKQILTLPFTESQVIILKYYNNFKNNDIAKLMDISRSSVKRYLRSGKLRLKNF